MTSITGEYYWDTSITNNAVSEESYILTTVHQETTTHAQISDEDFEDSLTDVTNLDVALNSGGTLRQCLTEVKRVGNYTFEELDRFIQTLLTLQILGQLRYSKGIDKVSCEFLIFRLQKGHVMKMQPILSFCVPEVIFVVYYGRSDKLFPKKLPFL